MKLESLKKQELINIILRKDETEKESSEELRKLKELIKEQQKQLEEKDLQIKSLTSKLEGAKADCLGTQQALEEVKNNLNDLRDEYDATVVTNVTLSRKLFHRECLCIVLGISFITALICAVFC